MILINEKNEVCWFKGILSLLKVQFFTCEASGNWLHHLAVIFLESSHLKGF